MGFDPSNVKTQRAVSVAAIGCTVFVGLISSLTDFGPRRHALEPVRKRAVAQKNMFIADFYLRSGNSFFLD